MSFDNVKNKLLLQTTKLSIFPWDKVELMLVINFNSGNFFGAIKNSTDIHIGNPDRPRKSNGRPKSNKTHIDLTSGDDLLPGFDPVLDFFPCTAGMAQGEKKKFKTILSISNLHSLGCKKNFKQTGEFFSDFITLNKLQNRNISGNPSIQLLEKDDIEELRILLGYETSLVMLLSNDGDYYALGLKNDEELIKSMIIKDSGGYKSKRVFRINNDTVVKVNELGDIDPVQGIETPETHKSTSSPQTPIFGPRSQPLPTAGYIYVITNERFTGWVKIGRTTKTPSERLSSYQTYSPSIWPYKLAHHIHTSNCNILENRIHNAIKSLGYDKEKEWFKIGPAKAIEIMKCLNFNV
jgi:hypothetical protein